MKILGLNSFTAKNGDHWLVASGVQKFSFPQGKKGYENCEHWFRNRIRILLICCSSELLLRFSIVKKVIEQLLLMLWKPKTI